MSNLTPSGYLIDLARSCAAPFIELPSICAVMISGSASDGTSDCYSDIDMMLYYNDVLPTEDQLESAR